ncbi:hypothetical protein [Paenibacillus amylolyticus]|uniref:hypothetical protein n=1 Tax=Paenibacillus TaxID=44249 RepID=UPI002499E71B|nr:hypothetical protein [Paenibacillus amylolyticus]WFA87740.1 hypothetical protein OGI70_12835 [Paenibacillus amylolyticus]
MSVEEQILAMRDPDFRASLSGFEHPSGSVDSNELTRMVGGGDQDPEFISITIYKCPTLLCNTMICTLTDACYI